ncbi:MAG: class B sortase [Lachnospiraceae bacterium]|nr:class B sortase [Lachnospiraceae bacterium]
MQEKNQQFTIGEFTFDTFHEYRDAQEDLKKIDLINQELDIHDQEVAVRLYNMLRDGQITFKSPIGEQFATHIADIVAAGYEDLLEDKAVAKEAAQKFQYQKVLGRLAAVLAVAFFGYFIYAEVAEVMHTRELERLARERQEAMQQTAGTEESSPAVEPQTTEEDTTNQTEESNPFARDQLIDPASLSVLPEYEEFLAQNPDLVGWLTIQGTSVDYPVVQKTDDNEYYLDHSFDGTENSAGTIYVDYRSDIVNPTTNTMVYGHNMKNGTMFGSLKNYLQEDFFKEYRYIQFNTIYEHRLYQVVSVGLSEVAYQDENGYRYYNFIQANNMEEWQEFVDNVSSLAIYQSDVTLSPSDEILTLSTCNSYTEDGRLFIVAKRIQ